MFRSANLNLLVSALRKDERWRTFMAEGDQLMAMWQAWYQDVENNIIWQQLWEQQHPFWENAVKALVNERTPNITDPNGKTFTQHHEEIMTIMNHRDDLKIQENRYIRMSNHLLMELSKQLTAPRSPLEWQHRLDWEEFGFDYSSDSIRYNAHFDVVRPRTGEILHAFDKRLHLFVKDFQDPRSISHNMMWINVMDLRIGGLVLMIRKAWHLRRENITIWFSSKSVDDYSMNISDEEALISTDLDFITAIAFAMRAKYPEYAGRRPKHGRNYMERAPPRYTFLVRTRSEVSRRVNPVQGVLPTEFSQKKISDARRPVSVTPADHRQDTTTSSTPRRGLQGGWITKDPGTVHTARSKQLIQAAQNAEAQGNYQARREFLLQATEELLLRLRRQSMTGFQPLQTRQVSEPQQYLEHLELQRSRTADQPLLFMEPQQPQQPQQPHPFGSQPACLGSEFNLSQVDLIQLNLLQVDLSQIDLSQVNLPQYMWYNPPIYDPNEFLEGEQLVQATLEPVTQQPQQTSLSSEFNINEFLNEIADENDDSDLLRLAILPGRTTDPAYEETMRELLFEMEEGDARQQMEAFFGAGDQTGANPETGDQQGEKRKRDDYDFDSG
ncbi:hypothetical protein N7450_002802 [Penicillium hetheringtonii]|uniref:Uncharacterized protein n=1 Tax=Penicillium hetheringtonii TaxID=911720 RepID=A0AAD6DY39_9EURO|nr:hypothetical protein N7450_002802 [Penicillium hetheringtonii]